MADFYTHDVRFKREQGGGKANLSSTERKER
jgi:hypothetical protein